MINLRPYQKEIKAAVFTAWKSNYRNVLLVMPTGMGKCLAENTPVIMACGNVKLIQEIVAGDEVMGPDSKPRKVLSTCSGTSDLYKITPVKGDPWVCNDVHVLTLKHTETKKIIDIELPDYLKQSKNFKHLHKQFRVGVEFPVKKVNIDPYVVGLYLAEGTHCNNSITNPDEEVLSYLNKWASRNNLKVNSVQGRGCKTLRFADEIQGWNKNIIKKLRQSCTSKEDRRIPKDFLINHSDIRLQVLAGILDGDGHYSGKCFTVTTKYLSLCNDILYLCRSLGFAAYFSKVKKGIKSSGFTGEYFNITISGHLNKIPTKIKRKQSLPRKQIKDVLNTGFTVENIGPGKYYGFELDGDGRFLLGDFTVTHNTKTFCSLVIDTLIPPTGSLPTAIMVHRKELVQQISLTLAEEGIHHNIIASRKDIKGIIAAQRRMFNKQFYNASAPVTVISVDTLISREDIYKDWVKTILQWITDEAAHVLKENKWGKAIAMFENARGLGVTATPERLDRKGLGSHVDGVFDIMVEGPPTRWGIENGYLSKYKIAVPPSDFAEHLESKSDTSDYSKQAMITASKKSRIVGDVVENYIKFANGKQAILFATDVSTAEEMEKKFLARGIVAKSLDGTTPDAERLEALIAFREKRVQVLINVDLFDEGLDVPGIECVIMARPTKSLGKFLQMVGRGLRVANDKPYMILIDHVGNVKYHGLPCNLRKWTLDRTNKRAQKLNFMRICSAPMCNAPYDRALTECPWCGTPAITQSRGEGVGMRPALERVDGDLELLDPEFIRMMEKKAQLEDPATVAQRVSNAVNPQAGLRAMKNQQERIATQRELIEAIATWAGHMKHVYKYTDRQIHKKFYLYHNQTITEALGEAKAEMEKTIEQLKNVEEYY
jgi:superfamily II DNA or RNA helicase